MLIIVDGSSLLYRYAVMGAVMGAINKVIQVAEKVGATDIVFVFDTNGESFRYKIYPKYKATRNGNNEVKTTIRNFYELLNKAGIAAYLHEEADDLVASIARQYSGKVIIITGDKDLMQLVSDRVGVYNLADGKIYTPEMVLAKWGVPPEKIADFLAIAGDASDNVPGVRGIGSKGAVQVLTGNKKLTKEQEESYRFFLQITTLSPARVDFTTTEYNASIFSEVAQGVARW